MNTLHSLLGAFSSPDQARNGPPVYSQRRPCVPVSQAAQWLAKVYPHDVGTENRDENIYVGNLSFNTSEENLRAEFARYGQVTGVNIIQDGMTHQPRGFGFVEMANDGEAANAIAGLNGASLDGRTIVVNEARPKAEHRDSRGRRGPRRRFGT